MDAEVPEAWTTLKNLIIAGAPLPDIKRGLSAVTPFDIENLHEDGQNLLHYAVASGRLNIMNLLFKEEYFLTTHEMPIVPYLHMACVLGKNNVVKKLLDKRPSDYSIKVSTENEEWKQLIEAHPFQGGDEDLHATIKTLLSQKESISALEVAALYQQVACLKSLLQYYPKKQWLAKAAERKEPAVMEMLLASMTFDRPTVPFGFEYALRATSTTCLDILLRYAENRKIALPRTNPYHFMYRWSTYYNNDCLTECTRVLLKHGYDVNTMQGRATYPLYSLVWHVNDARNGMNYEGPVALNDEFACLRELLAAGANPHFDE